MNNIVDVVLQMLQSGVGNLAAYLAAHVLLCLLPAFVIAGGMSALIPKQMITRFLGRNTPAWISYPAAAAAGFLLAVCSCTVIPLFAGIYKKGAGIGPAITFLFIAPAINILALIYTGNILGMDLAMARLLLSLGFGIGIGLIMALIFHKQDAAHDKATDALFAGQAGMRRPGLVFLLLLVFLLVAGTFQISPLTDSFLTLQIPWPGVDQVQQFLNTLVPADTGRGIEGLSVQGVVLIAMLGVIGLTAWKGFETIHEGFTAWTWLAAGLIGLTLILAAPGVQAHSGGIAIALTGKFWAVTGAVLLLGLILRRGLSEDEQRDVLWETWKFVKQIFPLLIAGVFTVGVIRVIIQPEWVEALAGQNTLLGNLAGVVFGVFLYFPTLVEVPIAQLFLDLGMHRGPLLAYLMADPELSVQSIIITAAIIGRLRAWTYVGWVALFSVLSGLVYGAWVDGASIVSLALLVSALVAVLAAAMWWIGRRNHNPVEATLLPAKKS